MDLTDDAELRSGGMQAAAAARQQPAGSSGRTGGMSAQDRHERWQSKLVHGTPAGRRGGSAADIVPQKRTPLEEQVYALKRKHPGVLLVIEARAPPLIHALCCNVSANEEAIQQPLPPASIVL
jgi:hypothetical protein